MARRKRNKQPNLPEATLERAREQANLPAEEDTGEDEAEEAAEVVAAKPAVTAAPKAAPKVKAAPSPRGQRKISSARLEQSKKRGEVDADMVEYMLEHPNKIVSEAELRAEYGHVLIDLRNMAALAAVLIVVMIVIAQLI